MECELGRDDDGDDDAVGSWRRPNAVVLYLIFCISRYFQTPAMGKLSKVWTRRVVLSRLSSFKSADGARIRDY